MAGRGSRHTQSVVSRHQQGARQYEDAAAGRLEVYETPDSLRSQDICFTEELEGRRDRVRTRVWAERCALREASRLRRTHTPNFCFSAARAPSLVRTSSHRSPSASQRLIHQRLIMMCALWVFCGRGAGMCSLQPRTRGPLDPQACKHANANKTLFSSANLPSHAVVDTETYTNNFHALQCGSIGSS